MSRLGAASRLVGRRELRRDSRRAPTTPSRIGSCTTGKAGQYQSSTSSQHILPHESSESIALVGGNAHERADSTTDSNSDAGALSRFSLIFRNQSSTLAALCSRREMDESKMQATAADLERALVDSLVEAAMPTSATTTDDSASTLNDATAQAEPEDDATEPTYQDGDLPDFSDSEEAPTGSDSKLSPFAKASAAAAGGGGGGGPAGKGPRRKIPLAAIKARMSGATPSTAKKAAPTAAAAAAAPVASTSSQGDTKGKGKSKELKLSDSQLDAVAKKLAAEHPELPKLSPEQVQELVATMQIDKDVLSGKKGLMGKGTKDMACVTLSPSKSPGICSDRETPPRIADRTSSGRRNRSSNWTSAVSPPCLPRLAKLQLTLELHTGRRSQGGRHRGGQEAGRGSERACRPSQGL